MVINVRFTEAVIVSCILALFFASLTLIPLGLWLTELPCLFLEFLGWLLFTLGITPSVYTLRIINCLLHR